MILSLFRRPTPAKIPRAPDDTRIYAIGDIHGRRDLLAELLTLISVDAETQRADRNVLIYLGDYVDRGLESRAVIDVLMNTRLPGFETIAIKGNHEDMLLRFLDNTDTAEMWCLNGGDTTLHSYGVKLEVPILSGARATKIQQAFIDAFPRHHFDFLTSLRPYHVEGDYFFTHAGVRPGVDLDAQDLQDLMWIRDEFLAATDDFGKVVVHGHSITEQPDFRHNRVGIDTGAFVTGKLTCLVLEGDRKRILQT